MATTTWGSTVPNTGAMKTSFVSKKIYTAAISECIFMDHVDVVTGFGKGKGESVTLQRIGRQTEATDYSLAETDRIPETAHSITGKVITVGEFGAAVPCTNLAKVLAQYDIYDATQGELKDQMKLAMDSRACRAFKQTLYKYVPTGATSASTATNGTAPTSALANVNVFHLGAIRDTLYGIYKAEPVDGRNYVGIFNTLGIRGIISDPEWEQWHVQLHPEAKFNHELGVMGQVRILETNHGGTTFGAFGLNNIGTGDCLGEGVVFGKHAVAYVEAMSPEIRQGKEDDFGRINSVCWYGIYEFSIIYDVANVGQLKVIHVTSSD